MSVAVLAAGLAFAPYCATVPKKPPVKEAKAEPEDVDIGPLIVSRNQCPAGTACGKALTSKGDKTIEQVAKEAGLTAQEIKRLCRTKTKLHTVRVGDTVSVFPTEAPAKVISIDAKEVKFSDGTVLKCGEAYIYLDIQLHVLVSKMTEKGNDRSVSIVVAVCPPGKVSK